MPALAPRLYNDPDCFTRNDGYTWCEPSQWNAWIRWVFLGIVLVFIGTALFLMACVTARQRRKQGRQPYWGTGWTAGPRYWRQPPPQYTPQPQNNGYYGGQNQGYYGQPPKYGQETGIELQQPPPTYNRSAEAEYAPPPGPPPAKNDGFIR